MLFPDLTQGLRSNGARYFPGAELLALCRTGCFCCGAAEKFTIIALIGALACGVIEILTT